MRVCIDYRDLNNATPKDTYPMPVDDLFIDATAGHEVLSFMDETVGYHQIHVVEEDHHKTAFYCPGFAGAFEYVVMPFGIKNAGATYQRAMNLIFHDILGKLIEVYIDDVVAGDFLGFLVHQKGIEISKDKAQAIISTSPPTTKKKLQQLIGRINFLCRFILNTAWKVQPFSSLLKLQEATKFVWEPQHQEAFNGIKDYVPYEPFCFNSTSSRHPSLFLLVCSKVPSREGLARRGMVDSFGLAFGTCTSNNIRKSGLGWPGLRLSDA
ncbi:hypothetical protein ACLB2K_021140 [Fragaria x ananassa]